MSGARIEPADNLPGNVMDLDNKSWRTVILYWLSRFRLSFRNWRFWVVQSQVIVISAAHTIIEATEFLPDFLYFLPLTLFIVPVVYAALYFGLVGSVTTMIWIIIINSPNWILFHPATEKLGVVFEMSLLMAVAIFTGRRVDRETAARRKAEDLSRSLKSYAAHIVQAQEQERIRISRELHDETIQTLTLIGRRLHGIEENIQSSGSATSEEVKEIRQLAEETTKGLRGITRSIRPPILDDLGIVPAIRRLVTESNKRSGIKGKFQIVGEKKRLPPNIEIEVYRIAQEAISNVEHHSNATEMAVTMSLNSGEAELQVSDNGIGFNAALILSHNYSSGKLGLLGMQERADLIDGKLTVESIPRKGTTITLIIPLLETESKAISK
jgi:signal transduction histidine kinase